MGEQRPADGSASMGPEQIERRSMETIRYELGARAESLDPLEAPVVMRVIHATADFSFADSLTFTPGAVEAGLRALASGATIVTDTNMALAGVSKPACRALGCTTVCHMADPVVAARARADGTTRAVASMDAACEVEGPLVIAVGNAPTALIRIVELVRDGRMRPDLVIGVPVGFVNVVEAKELLLASGVNAIVARGRRGGSNVAAAIVNALLYQLSRPGWRKGGDGRAASPAAPAASGEGVPAELAALPRDARVAVFAGTTEGRELCERMSAAGRPCRAFVATEYGDAAMGAPSGVEVRVGRLDAVGMADALAGCAAAVDATHPYARQVGSNVARACVADSIPLVRLLRPATPLPRDAVVVEGARAAAEALAGTQGPIMLTTGANELAEFVAGLGPGGAGRVFARVLPTPEAILACDAVGIGRSHVLCVQGPCSRGLNVAMLRDVGARWLVTKDSGVVGGMPEKVAAAQECAARLVVIGRPPEGGRTWTLGQVCAALGV
ncbi:MAG: precorrin-6A reductase [Coriobacteriales bacterium]|jgi:precorrin-8X/cobalt-precorrin-8 methylmutase